MYIAHLIGAHDLYSQWELVLHRFISLLPIILAIGIGLLAVWYVARRKREVADQKIDKDTDGYSL